MSKNPYCHSLLFADFIQRELSGKWYLSGIFDMMSFPAFPAESTIAVFFGLIDGQGTVSLKFQIEHVDNLFSDADHRVAGEASGNVTFEDPLQNLQGLVVIPTRFDSPGAYNLELMGDGEHIATRRLIIKALETPEQP